MDNLVSPWSSRIYNLDDPQNIEKIYNGFLNNLERYNSFYAFDRGEILDSVFQSILNPLLRVVKESDTYYSHYIVRGWYYEILKIKKAMLDSLLLVLDKKYFWDSSGDSSEKISLGNTEYIKIVLDFCLNLRGILVGAGFNYENSIRFSPTLFSILYVKNMSHPRFISLFVKRFLDFDSSARKLFEENLLESDPPDCFFSLILENIVSSWLPQSDSLEEEMDLLFKAINECVKSKEFLIRLKTRRFNEKTILMDVSYRLEICQKSFFNVEFDSLGENNPPRSGTIWDKEQFFRQYFWSKWKTLLYPLVEIGLHLKAEDDEIEDLSTETLRVIYGI